MNGTMTIIKKAIIQPKRFSSINMNNIYGVNKMAAIIINGKAIHT